MITEKDLQEAIAECQGQRNPNANTCMKLAAYYTIKDHLFNKPQAVSYSYAPGPSETVNVSDDSEFLKVVNGKNLDEVFSVMDELMATINVINPRLYEGVMAKLLL